MSPLLSKPLKDFVYFRCTLPLASYPHEGGPLAEALSNRLRASGVQVDPIQEHWEDLRMGCRFERQLFWLDVTTYVEVQPPEFSVAIKPAGRWWVSWFGRSRLKSVIERVDKILHTDPAFTEIRWHRSRDLRKRTPGSDHPFT